MLRVRGRLDHNVRFRYDVEMSPQHREIEACQLLREFSGLVGPYLQLAENVLFPDVPVQEILCTEEPAHVPGDGAEYYVDFFTVTHQVINNREAFPSVSCGHGFGEALDVLKHR